jgi:hypothetical protein
MLAKAPAQRPPDARAVARTFEDLLAELVAEEGRLEVAEFLTAAFAEERRTQADRIASAIASATGVTATAKPAPAPVLAPARRRTRSRAALVGALGAVALAAVAALAWWQLAGADGRAAQGPDVAHDAVENAAPGEREARAEPIAPEASPTAPAERPADEGETRAGSIERPASPAAPGEPPAEEPGVATPAAADGPGAEPQATERTRRRPRGARVPDRSRTGVPMWSWQ